MSLHSSFIDEFLKIAFMQVNDGEEPIEHGDIGPVTRRSTPEVRAEESRGLATDLDGTYLDVPQAERRAIHDRRRKDPVDNHEPDIRDVRSRVNEETDGGLIT